MDNWKHRRIHSYAAMLAGLVYPVLTVLTDSVQLGTIAIPFYLFVTTIISSYIGMATLDDKWKK